MVRSLSDPKILAQPKQLSPKKREELARLITDWYLTHRRDLPWRSSKDPYRIWISEVMLQQTTVQAVVPYFENFIRQWPTVEALAQAPLEQVLQAWSGLGYYSRARNLHKAAILFSSQGFPQKAEELAKFPGLGPYTSRAVAALAFDEKVGVLDGNVIRVFSRLFNLPVKHWEPAGRQILQSLSDQIAEFQIRILSIKV